MCGDDDSDGCDDCSAGQGYAPENDGIDVNNDGLCEHDCLAPCPAGAACNPATFECDCDAGYTKTGPNPALCYANVLDYGAVCDGEANDTAAIQNLINTVATGVPIAVPVVANYCRLTAALKITRAMSIVGFAPEGNSTLRRTDIYPLTSAHSGGAILDVNASGVLVDGLILTGSEYGNVQVRNTHGIWT